MASSGTGGSLAPIVLTGFMGTGKTSVGRMLAQALGREFVDMDASIEAEQGLPIREIFATRGESYFREREAEWCARLAHASNHVIATGGGALVDPRNRAAFRDAIVICLEASPAEILARLGHSQPRPLLATPNPQARIAELLAARRAAYAEIERHVDTSGKSIEQIVQEIVDMVHVK